MLKMASFKLYKLCHNTIFPKCKCYGPEGKGFPNTSVTAPRGEGGFLHASVAAPRRTVSWRLRAKKYHKVTQHHKPHTRDLLGKTQEDGCLHLGEAAEN